MAYTESTNSSQAPLNQRQQTILLTDGITDPVVLQNFEKLNKQLTGRLQGQALTKANIVFSRPFGSNSFLPIVPSGGTVPVTVTPGQLQVQIQTNGNPVRLKIAPFAYSQAKLHPYNTASVLEVGSITETLSTALACFGWTRQDASGKTTVISYVRSGGTVSVSSLVPDISSAISYALPLPAFEMDDVVPTGLYTYQFFVNVTSIKVFVNARNIQAVAYELG